MTAVGAPHTGHHAAEGEESRIGERVPPQREELMAGNRHLELRFRLAPAAVQEDADLVGLSCLSGAHRYLFPRVVELLKERGAGDIPVIGGGIIPERDFPVLYDAGIRAIFTPGASLDSIVAWIRENVTPEGAKRNLAAPDNL